MVQTRIQYDTITLYCMGFCESKLVPQNPMVSHGISSLLFLDVSYFYLPSCPVYLPSLPSIPCQELPRANASPAKEPPWRGCSANILWSFNIDMEKPLGVDNFPNRKVWLFCSKNLCNLPFRTSKFVAVQIIYICVCVTMTSPFKVSLSHP